MVARDLPWVRQRWTPSGPPGLDQSQDYVIVAVSQAMEKPTKTLPNTTFGLVGMIE